MTAFSSAAQPGAAQSPDAALSLHALQARLAKAEEAAAALPRLLRVAEKQREERQRTSQELAKLRGEVQQARRDEQDALQRIGRLQGELASAKAEAAAARKESSQTHALYAQAFASRSWRWTAPLRGEMPRPGKHRRKELTAGTKPPPRALSAGDPDLVAPRIAVVAHLFYADLWDGLLEQLTNLQLPYDLHLSLTAGHSDGLLAAVLARVPTANVVVLPNRGRDVAPFAHLLSSGALDGYDAILKLHGKRSRHRGGR